MKNPKLASRYAGALYDFAVETANVENAFHDILHIKEIIVSHHELKTVLESPIIPYDKKKKIINGIFQHHFCCTVLDFLNLIVKKRRTPQLLMICEQFIKIYYLNHNIKEADITTAQPLSEKTTQYLKAVLEEETPYSFIIHYAVDASIIGGIIIKIDDLYFDAAIKTKINKLKREFSQNVYAAGF
jgi:F-type H+-transporting ATPase subunit delta